MKRILLIFTLLAACFNVFAQKKGYRVEFNFKEPVSGDVVYLARYYGKPFPTVFKMDSVMLDNKNRKKVVFESREKILGGFYVIIFNNRTKVMDFLLDNGYKMTIDLDTTGKRVNSTVKGSQDNEINFELGRIGERYDEAFSKVGGDTAKLRQLQDKIGDEIEAYRKNVVKKHPNLLITKYYKTFLKPETPKGPHYLEDGKTVDSFYEIEYLSRHYWDNFDLKDDRLLIAPIYERALETYFDYLVYPIPDTVMARADELLKRTEGTEDLYRFTMRWLTNKMLNSKVMGMDEVFVHLVENYHMKGKTPWLDEAGVKEYVDIMGKISPTSLGQTAPGLVLQNVFTHNDVNLLQVPADYLVVLFWDIDCGNCRREIAALDTMYQKDLKGKGVKIFAVATNGQLDKLQTFLEEHHATEWINVADFKNTKEYKEKYNVMGTPTMYLLDKDKKIIGKKISHENLPGLLEWHINKEKKKVQQTH